MTRTAGILIAHALGGTIGISLACLGAKSPALFYVIGGLTGVAGMIAPRVIDALNERQAEWRRAPR